jgi:hypothetical protein
MGGSFNIPVTPLAFTSRPWHFADPSFDERIMNIRRGLFRVWVVLTALLLLTFGASIHQEWLRENQVYGVEIGNGRLEVSRVVFEKLLPWERYQVLDRMAWLNGIQTMPSIGTVDMLDPDREATKKKLIEVAKARLKAGQTLPPKLEALARGDLIRPDMFPFLMRIGLFVAGIAILWATLYVGFWVASGFQKRPAR